MNDKPKTKDASTDSSDTSRSVAVAISSLTSLSGLDRVASALAAVGTSTTVRVIGDATAISSALARLKPFFTVVSAQLSLRGTAETANRSASIQLDASRSAPASLRGDKPVDK